MKKITAIVLGAGSRGHAYADYSLSCPEELEIVGVAEPDEKKRTLFADQYHIPVERCFADWQEILQQPQMADAAFVCTLDHMHTQPAIQALKKGYHVLLEKPMSNKKEECLAIAQAAEESGKVLTVCHVLRYTSFYQTIKKLIETDAVGEVVTVDQIENVGYWHQAHSFVRGNWRNSDQTSIMILQKSCHDLDIISWLIDKPCTWVSSFGRLSHFTKENWPQGAPDNCMKGCPYSEECLYYAPKIYLTGKKTWPVDVITTDLTEEGIKKALQEGPYGRCVYACDNNVVDHQVVNLEYEGGATATFTMTAFGADITRQLKIMGTKGQIMGDLDKEQICLQRFGEKEPEQIVPERGIADQFGHGGGDYGIVKNFIGLVNGNGDNLTSAKASLQSHLMCFAAEQSRLEHRAIPMSEMEGE
ncbi:MAG: Gfo/Idh/MocA family oxidoreductase [Eubacteriales bacterium]|nr:Gfo/Idh/MocA family oxidoreductase [Eubacteriales bacterium]